MNGDLYRAVEATKRAAIDVLMHNSRGPYFNLPRAAGWGYPEPYTRDLMICALGVLACDHEPLTRSLKRALETLAENQSIHGHIPSLVHDGENRGASDTTPLFLLALGVYRMKTGEADFLAGAAGRALTWMDYQSPDDRVMVAQLPTSDWRDEQWVLGNGLFVNTIVYSYLHLFGRGEQAQQLRWLMGRLAVTEGARSRHIRQGLTYRNRPYYALWAYKADDSDRVDVLGNSLAILAGIAAPSRAQSLIWWIEQECQELRRRGLLAVDLPPNLFPYILPEDPDWRSRYERFNRPGDYHNGGVWPFVCGFYVAALVAAGKLRLAEAKLAALTELVRPAREHPVEVGFNEWIRAQTGEPCGEDWQSWSAAMYLYAAVSVQSQCTPFFQEIRHEGRCPASRRRRENQK